VCGPRPHCLCDGDEINIDANCHHIFRAETNFVHSHIVDSPVWAILEPLLEASRLELVEM
jgi:hypothetical protein